MFVIFLDWKYYDVTNKYYKLFTTEKSWSNARSDCTSTGGELASITSLDENNFIQSFFILKGTTSRAWIGGRSSDGNTWTWKDGTTWSYEKWNSNEGTDGGKTSLGAAGGSWNDEDGTALWNSICKKS